MSAPTISRERLDDLGDAAREQAQAVLEGVQSRIDAAVAAGRSEVRRIAVKSSERLAGVYAKRRKLIQQGVGAEATGDSAHETTKEEKGIPGFWCSVLCSHQDFADRVTSADSAALQYLEDIQCVTTKDAIVVKFVFSRNCPFLEPSGSVLSRTYFLNAAGEVDRIDGAAPQWRAGKELTIKRLGKGKRGEKVKRQRSFFQFFEKKHDGDAVESLMEELELMTAIRDDIVPDAVALFSSLTENTEGLTSEQLRTLEALGAIAEEAAQLRSAIESQLTQASRTNDNALRALYDERKEQILPLCGHGSSFWCEVFSRHPNVGPMVSPADAAVLEYVSDVRVTVADDATSPASLVLTIEFIDGPFMEEHTAHIRVAQLSDGGIQGEADKFQWKAQGEQELAGAHGDTSLFSALERPPSPVTFGLLSAIRTSVVPYAMYWFLSDPIEEDETDEDSDASSALSDSEEEGKRRSGARPAGKGAAADDSCAGTRPQTMEEVASRIAEVKRRRKQRAREDEEASSRGQCFRWLLVIMLVIVPLLASLDGIFRLFGR